MRPIHDNPDTKKRFANINPDKIREFSYYISKFGNNILEDCEELKRTVQALSCFIPPEKMQLTESTLNNVETIVHATAPIFEQLDEIFNIYAEYITRISYRKIM